MISRSDASQPGSLIVAAAARLATSVRSSTFSGSRVKEHGGSTGPARARAVREPRAVLAEFGTVLPAGIAVRVHDSTADMRYLVLPERPPGTAALDEAALAALGTRDSMIGVAPARSP